MTNEEAKEAFFKGRPVKCNGIFYVCISAIIYRKGEKGELIISAELLDKKENSVTIARTKDIEVL